MQKIKSKIINFIESDTGKDILIVIIVILVGISSFLLGRLSNQASTNGVKIEYQGQQANTMAGNELLKPNESPISLNPSVSEKISNNSRGSYFASKKGKKYYPNNCSSGKNIKQENKIYFQTTIEAEKAGYTLSSSC